MLFNGESKGRVVSSSGKKRDTSRSSVIEESRKLREQRMIEKERNISAILLQKHIRRYLSQKETRDNCLTLLTQQLTTISRIQQVIVDFTMPLESITTLLKYTVFSKVILRNLQVWINSISILTKSFQTFNLVDYERVLADKTKAHAFQIVLAKFIGTLFDSVNSPNHQPYIIKFLTSSLKFKEDHDNSSLFSRAIRGAFGILGQRPYQVLREFFYKQHHFEMQNIATILLQFCEVGLHERYKSEDGQLLGSCPREVILLLTYLICFAGSLELLYKVHTLSSKYIRKLMG